LFDRPELQRYNITGVADFAKEMEEKGLGKPKVSLQFELSQSGITKLVKAEAVVEEIYTVEEEVEVEDDEESEKTEDATKAATEEATESDEAVTEEATESDEAATEEATERKTEEVPEEGEKAAEEEATEAGEEAKESADSDNKESEEKAEKKAEEKTKEKPKKKTTLVEKVCCFLVSHVRVRVNFFQNIVSNSLDVWHPPQKNTTCLCSKGKEEVAQENS
jgi:hypothetical protein